MGLPPSSSGSNQVRVTASLVMSEGVTLVGGPGGSEIDRKECDFCQCLCQMRDHFWKTVNKHTKGILGNDWCMLCRFSNTKLVLSTNPKDVLLHSSELAGLEGCVFDCSWELYPFFFVCLSTFHDVVGNGRAAVIPRRIPRQAARLTGDLRYVKGSWRARFI